MIYYKCRRKATVAFMTDQCDAEVYSIRIGPLVVEHLEELQALGWTVRLGNRCLGQIQSSRSVAGRSTD